MTKKGKKKLFIIAGAVVIIAVLVIVNLTRSSAKTIKVTTAKVKQGKLVSLVTASGKVKPKTEVKISANVSGEIVGLPVVEGQRVRKGDLLVQVEPKQYEAQLRQSQAGYEAAVANMKLEDAGAQEAKLVNDRQKALFEKQLTSKETYDAARTRYESAQASLDAARSRVQQAKAEVDRATESLSYTTIRSPIEGSITDLRSELGEIVMGSLNYQASVIMVVSDLSEIEVQVEVDETDVDQVALGQSAKIKLDAMPDTSYAGRITEIGNTAKVSALGTQDQVTNFLVTVLLTDSVPNIKPGMTATCDITTDERTGAVKIPIGAVVLRDESVLKKKKGTTSESSSAVGVSEAVAAGDGDSAKAAENEEENAKKKPIEGVFVVRGGKAAFVTVTTGIADQQNIEIKTGLQKGDEIIVGPFRTLRTLEDGEGVEAKEEKTAQKGKEGAKEGSGDGA
jgi:HlyD family secretion protein